MTCGENNNAIIATGISQDINMENRYSTILYKLPILTVLFIST